MSLGEKIRLTILLDKEIHKKLKVKCAQKGITITEALTLQVQDWLIKK